MAPLSVVVVGQNCGRTIVDQLESAAVQLVGVCDLDQELAATTATALGTRHYADLATVLADPDVAAVALFTGPTGRADLIRRAIRAGKHVMTTKPVELDPYAPHDVLAEAARLRRIVHLNSPSVVLPPDLAQIADWCANLDLGRPVGAHASV